MSRWFPLAVLATSLLAGCGGSLTPVSHQDELNPGCHSHYEHVADAPTKAALLRELRHAAPRVRSVRAFPGERHDRKLPVALLDARPRTVMSLDVWRRDGRWTAQRHFMCFD